jgi:hypothetical protein
MEAIIALVLIIAGLVGLDLAAIHWGVDSRDKFRDGKPSWWFR